MAVETLTALTTQAEMERLFSTLAVDLRADDDSDGVAETGVIQDCIDYASDAVYQHAIGFHTAEKLSESLWVRRRATIIACWYLSQRRGNPSNFEALHERVMAELEKVQTCQLQIPRVPWRSDLTGGVSNYTVSDWHTIKKTRVEPGISTGGRSDKQHIDHRVAIDEFVVP